MPLNWQGDEVVARMRQAQEHAVNQTMARSVVHAKRNHEWHNRTGTLEGGIQVAEFARPIRNGVRGVWGVRDVVYARIHELGGVIKARTARALRFFIGGRFVQVRQVTMPARPYLRPAADVEYPKLAARIRRHLDGQGGGDA